VAVRAIIWTLLPFTLLVVPAVDMGSPIHNDPNGVPISGFVYGGLVLASLVL
jgi:hypothetical protein